MIREGLTCLEGPDFRRNTNYADDEGTEYPIFVIQTTSSTLQVFTK